MIYMFTQKYINPYILTTFVFIAKDLADPKVKKFFLVSRIPKNWNELENFEFNDKDL